MKLWLLGVLILVYAVYVIVGGLIFMVLERDREEETITSTANYKSTFLSNHECVSEQTLEDLIEVVIDAYDEGIIATNSSSDEVTWNPQTSIYFAVTVVTTIGYGNIAPVTPGGRVFCVFFALFGIPLCLVMLGAIGAKLSFQINRLDKWLTKKMSCGWCEKHPKVMKWSRFFVIQMIFITLFMLIPAGIFTAVEEGWTYGTALYYTVITLTTVGFGDYAAGFNDGWGHPIYRIMVACWIILGLVWMATLITHTQTILEEYTTKVEDKSEKKKKDEESAESGKNDTKENSKESKDTTDL